MRHILVVDDEPRIRKVISDYAEFYEFQVTEAEDGEEAVKLCKEMDFDLIIMDIMMQRLDGISAWKQIKETKDIPVIFLSARTGEYDKLFGFSLGIDDYVTKPFSPKELMARCNAVLLRHQATKRTSEVIEEKKEETVFHVKGITLDTAARTVFIDDERIEMTPKEFDLLTMFIKNKNSILSREELLSKIWGYDYFGDDRTLDTHIKNLRNNLGEYRGIIVTLRGVGYRLED